MSFSDERQAIEGRFFSNWTQDAPVRYENIDFNIPHPPRTWVSLHIVNGDGNQISINPNSLYRFLGVIMIQIFAPENSGTDAARDLADAAATIFRSVQFSADSSGEITCLTPSITNVGIEDGWYQLNVSVPYHRDIQFG